ncbi:hypothetical protein AUJ14_05750 [Candidatus Micrarchaeota archaeon CG1_02_55_22]|nr:MAG: hypothetical protein AUJ14_05750 [Candidatus Micrarchaeota archaeon CG1_02_55_22]
MALLYLAVLVFPQPWLYAGLAGIEGAFLEASGVPVVVDGALLHAGGASFEIVAECSGLIMVAMLVALFFASGCRRWGWLAGGIVFLLLFNVARLWLTLYAGAAWGQSALGVVHPVLWFVDAGIVLAWWAKMEALL